MPIPITCGNCGVSLRAPDTAVGRKVKCAKCGEGILVPGPAAAPYQEAPMPAPARPRPARPAPAPAYDPPAGGGRGGSEADLFTFDGSVGDYLGTAILATLLTQFTCGIGFPWAMCMIQSWKTSHTLIGGRRLRFVGTGGEFFGLCLKSVLLTIVTLGIYSFWVMPIIQRWFTEKTEFET